MTDACSPELHNWKPTEITVVKRGRVIVRLVCLRCAHITEATTPQGAVP